MFGVRRWAFGVCSLLIHARRDSNPQPTVLETATLPIELLAYLIFLVRLIFLFLAFASTLADEEEEVEEDC